MRKNRQIAGILAALMLAEALLCAGCGTTDEASVPELMEPVSANASCRPVELGQIGKTNILYASVVTKDYCCFYDTNAEIAEITVDIGEHVEAGDIVAYADVDMARETLEDLKAELTNENKNYDINSRMTQVKIAQAQAAEEMDEAERARLILAEQENLRYDGLLHEYRVGKINESIAQQQKIIEDGTLTAEHAGTVTYTKNLGQGTNAGPYENIVVISDPQDVYLELAITIDQYHYTNYEVKYLMYAGKRCEVTEIPYSMDEVIMAKAGNQFPNVRISCADAKNLVLGEAYPVYFREKSDKEVPMIGRDSLYGEEGAYFVYVVNENGEQEKRDVTIGEMDANYAHVLDGVSEGELVYYASDARMPGEYDEYTVELSDYEIENISRNYELSDERTVWYNASYAGTVTEVFVKRDDVVEAGDLLYTIDSGQGKAALKEAMNEIRHENTSYTKTIQGIDEQIAGEVDENARTLLSLQKELEAVNHEYRLRGLQKSYDKIAKNNDGSGKVSVYAKAAGTIQRVVVSDGQYVKMGEQLLAIGEKTNKKLLVRMVKLEKEKNYLDNIADFGESITITVDNKTYKGRCSGWAVYNNNIGKVWVSSDEDGANLSTCTDSGYNCAAFFVEMEDESFYEDMPKGKVSFSYLKMQKVIAIPASLVDQETRITNPNEPYYFVWRVTDSGLVKQYVMIDKELSDRDTVVILSGVKEKDVLAREK